MAVKRSHTRGFNNGKSLLAKALGVSQLIYIASMLSVPEMFIKSVQTQLFSFLWKNKKDKIKRASHVPTSREWRD